MFDPPALVGFHAWLSLIALATGAVVTIALIRRRAMPGWTAVFLLAAVATSATGFAPPFVGALPSRLVGGIALVAAAVALLAQYRFRLAGAWRWISPVAATTSIYLVAFVGVVQAFLTIPAVKTSLRSPAPAAYA